MVKRATIVTYESRVIKNRFNNDQVDFAIHENDIITKIQIPQL